MSPSSRQKAGSGLRRQEHRARQAEAVVAGPDSDERAALRGENAEGVGGAFETCVPPVHGRSPGIFYT